MKQCFKNKQYTLLINKSVTDLYDVSFVKDTLFIKRCSTIKEKYNSISYASIRGKYPYNHSNRCEYINSIL